MHKKTPPNERRSFRIAAVWTRLELATPCVTGRYSNQLNYQTRLLKNVSLTARQI